jgi:CBS domain-containing protein
LALMQEHAVHHVPVLGADGALAGILTERDLLLAASRFLQSSVDVSEVMHRGVVTVTPDTPLQQAAALLARHKIGGLPVVGKEGAVVGVITETDMLIALVDVLNAARARPARPTVMKVRPKPVRRTHKA